MAVKASISINIIEKGKDAPKYIIQDDLDGRASLEDFIRYTKGVLISTALTVLKEEQAEGFDSDPITVIDNRQAKNINDVNPLGRILFVSRADKSQILIDTFASILEKSPVSSGNYEKQNIVTFNGKEIASTPQQLAAWIVANPNFKPNDTMRFLNLAPYARKLERYGVSKGHQKFRITRSKGRAGKQGKKVLAPNGTYYLTYQEVKANYKNQARIVFEFLPGSSLGIASKLGHGAQRGKTHFKARNKREGIRGTSSYLYPTISITFTAGGA